VPCCLCRSVVLAWGGNTSNLFRHLKIHHTKEYVSIEKGNKKQKSNNEETAQSTKQIIQGETIERTKPYTRNSQRWKEITGSVVYFMAKEMIPISTVEKVRFTKMVKN